MSVIMLANTVTVHANLIANETFTSVEDSKSVEVELPIENSVLNEIDLPIENTNLNDLDDFIEDSNLDDTEISTEDSDLNEIIVPVENTDTFNGESIKFIYVQQEDNSYVLEASGDISEFEKYLESKDNNMY